jgi:hypothetical protein
MLSSSDADCDHNGEPVSDHIFRRLSEGGDSLVSIEATRGWKWFKLKEEKGDDWIAYQYLGTREQAEKMYADSGDVSSLDAKALSIHAPDGVESH